MYLVSLAISTEAMGVVISPLVGLMEQQVNTILGSGGSYQDT